MIRVGIIGMGMMGRTHTEAYAKLDDVTVVAVADQDPKRAAGDLSGTEGNVLESEGTGLGPDVKGVTDYNELLARDDVDLVDVCVPTPFHREVATAALATGKHVMCEKPLARTVEDAQAIADAAAAADGLFMPAMCMRFWPEWVWLKEAVAGGRYGGVRGATFRRVASMPGGWYENGGMSGGALLDLHIHDTDFIHYLFGMPAAVYSRGYSGATDQPDHLVTHYVYDDVPLVCAEGGWCLADGHGFSMQYTVNFAGATAVYDLAAEHTLELAADGKREPVQTDSANGYVGEIRYFLECVRRGGAPATVTAEDAVAAMKILEAERRSIETGEPISL